MIKLYGNHNNSPQVHSSTSSLLGHTEHWGNVILEHMMRSGMEYGHSQPNKN